MLSATQHHFVFFTVKFDQQMVSDQRTKGEGGESPAATPGRHPNDVGVSLAVISGAAANQYNTNQIKKT